MLWWLISIVLAWSLIHVRVSASRPLLPPIIYCLSLLLSDNLWKLESNAAEFNYVVNFSFVALLSELTKRQPNLGVGILVIFLINLVWVVDPKEIILLVNKSNSGVVVEILVFLVNDILQVFKLFEFDLVREAVYLNYQNWQSRRGQLAYQNS